MKKKNELKISIKKRVLLFRLQIQNILIEDGPKLIKEKYFLPLMRENFSKNLWDGKKSFPENDIFGFLRGLSFFFKTPVWNYRERLGSSEMLITMKFKVLEGKKFPTGFLYKKLFREKLFGHISSTNY